MSKKKVQGSEVQSSKVEKTKNPEPGTRNPKPIYDDLLGRPFDEFCSDHGGDGCFGLAIEVCRRIGKPLPDYRTLALNTLFVPQEEIEKHLPKFQAVQVPEPGDLALMRNFDGEGYHIGVIVERGWFVHATSEHGVIRTRLNHPLYKDRIEGIYRPKINPSTLEPRTSEPRT